MVEGGTEETKYEQDQFDSLRGRPESKNNLQPNSLFDITTPEIVPMPTKKFRFSKSKSTRQKKVEASNDSNVAEKRLFAKIFGRTHKTENVVNMDLIETQAGLDTRAQYGDVRDLMQTDATGRTMIHRA